MSETRARASRLARWFGSFERNGLRGRLAPPSPGETAGKAPAGVTGDRGGGGVGAGAAGRTEALDGTNGADGPEIAGEEGGVNAGGGLAAGVNGGVWGGELNSGKPDDGEGGVAVAVTDARSTASGLAWGAIGVSLLTGCGAGAGRCT